MTGTEGCIRRTDLLWLLLLLPVASMASPESDTFDAGRLRYRVEYASGKPASVNVSMKNSGDDLCAEAAILSAQHEIGKRWPLGHEIGKDNISVIPTSGKRRETIRFDKAVAVLSVFSKSDGRCESFDRATFF